MRYISLATGIVLGAVAAASFTMASQLDGAGRDSGNETAFLAENNAAMSRMMSGMTVKPTGNIDVDFAAMMIPHHQGAIDMAVAELRYGKNTQLRRIAQEIIVDQQQEIVAMDDALGQTLPRSAPAPTQALPDARPLGPVPSPTHLTSEASR